MEARTASVVRGLLGIVCLWAAAAPLLAQPVCQLEMSVDEHFIVDRHPALENVWLVGGGSGHGFKHGPVLGDYVARRVMGQDKSPELETVFRLKAQTFG